jgi:uncharacterized protein (DUF3084 family)
VADNRPETILNFLETVQQSGQAVDLQAIATTDIFTVGPVQVDLVAVRDGRILFQTGTASSGLDSSDRRNGEGL